MLDPSARRRSALALITALLSSPGSGCGGEEPSASASEGSETPPVPEYSCAALPLPAIRQLDGPLAAADVAFDDQGQLIGSNTQDLFKAASASEPPALWIPAVPARAALRTLSDGRVALVQEMFRRVLLFAPDGSSELLVSDLIYPFGLVEGPDGAVYIADQDRIVRVELGSGALEVWLETPDFQPRWLSFDLDGAAMFVGGRNEVIHRVPIDAEGAAGEAQEWGYLPVADLAEPPGGSETGGSETGESEPFALIDGLGVDACGNVYAAEFHSRALYKFSPAGGEAELFVQWEHGEYGHGLQWGSGLGEWSATALYLPQPYNDFNVIEVELGVPSR